MWVHFQCVRTLLANISLYVHLFIFWERFVKVIGIGSLQLEEREHLITRILESSGKKINHGLLNFESWNFLSFNSNIQSSTTWR